MFLSGRRDDPNYVYTEKDWNDTVTVDMNGYAYSKVVAEKYLWDFVEKENPHVRRS